MRNILEVARLVEVILDDSVSAEDKVNQIKMVRDNGDITTEEGVDLVFYYDLTLRSVDLALKKLSPDCKHWLGIHADLARKAADKGSFEEVTENCKKIRGFLECLATTGTISEREMKTLYLHYVSKMEKIVM